MIELSFNEDFIWRKCTGQKDNGDLIYADPVTIRGRCTFKRHMIHNKMGNEEVSEASVITKALVDADDTLEIKGREWPVKAISIATMLTAAEHHRKVWL